MSGTARILLVADDSREMASLKALLAEAAPDRDLHPATSSKEALAALVEHDFEIVICDLGAGPEVGANFLQEVWKQRPRTVRFLLARGLTPDLMVTCALGSHHFIQKPLDAHTLKTALTRADAINQYVRNDRIQSLVSRMRTLPSRPSLYLEVMRELRSPTASASTVGELVEKDLAISTKLIQVVNSAFYGLAQQVTDPAAAVLLLGLETTASLVLSIEAFARFDKVKPIYFSMDKVWRHSQSVAASAKKIAELLSNDQDVARNAFTAGLLHDIGKLALALNFEDQYQGAIKLAEKQKLPASEVEAQVFGATHAETGAYLLSVWGLPLPIVEAVARHHQPARTMDKVFTASTALHIAEQLEYSEDPARRGSKEVMLDLAYPETLHLEGRINELKAIVRRDSLVGDVEKSEKSTISSAVDMQAETAALPANGQPAPLVNVAPTSRESISKRAMFAMIGILSVAIACAIAYVTKTQTAKAKEAIRVSELEEAANRKNQLSNWISESSEAAVQKDASEETPAPVAVNDAVKHLKLQAVMFNGQRSSLVINGFSLHVGDEIDGVKIIEVQPNEVIVEREGAKYTLRLQ
ncbi:MAG TPA: HDOD domain-containing protein [Verrucomicrobiae bacterium]